MLCSVIGSIYLLIAHDVDKNKWVKLYIQQNSAYPDAGYPDRLGSWDKFVENSTKPTCLEIGAPYSKL